MARDGQPLRRMNRWSATVLRLARHAIDGREPADRCRSCAFRVSPASLPAGELRGTAINLARALYERRPFHCHLPRRADGEWQPDRARVCAGYAALPDPDALRFIAGIAIGASTDSKARELSREFGTVLGWPHPEEDA